MHNAKKCFHVQDQGKEKPPRFTKGASLLKVAGLLPVPVAWVRVTPSRIRRVFNAKALGQGRIFPEHFINPVFFKIGFFFWREWWRGWLLLKDNASISWIWFVVLESIPQDVIRDAKRKRYAKIKAPAWTVKVNAL